MGRFDWNVIRSAATAGLVVVVPAALVSELLLDRSAPSIWTLLFALVTLFGFTTAGYAAGRLRTDIPMSHGAVSALLCYVVVQAFGTVRRLASGDEINPVAYPFLAMVAMVCGLAGALFADWYLRKSRREQLPG